MWIRIHIMTLVRRAFAEVCSVSFLLVVNNIVCYKIIGRSLLSSAALTVFGVWQEGAAGL